MIAASPSVAEYRFKSMNANAKASDWHSPCRGVLKAAPFDSSFVNRFAVLRQFKANQREAGGSVVPGNDAHDYPQKIPRALTLFPSDSLTAHNIPCYPMICPFGEWWERQAALLTRPRGDPRRLSHDHRATSSHLRV